MGGARTAGAWAAERLRHQSSRRPDDPPLLGRELRPDLSGAEAARGGGLDRGQRRLARRRARGASTRSPRPGAASCASWLAGTETRIELRDESLLRLFFADTLPRGDALGLLAARREGYAQMLAYLQLARRRHRRRIRRSSTSCTAGRSTTANGGSNGANGRSAGCAGPPRGPARPDLAVDPRARPAAVRRRGGAAGARLLRRVARSPGSARGSRRRRSCRSRSPPC